MNDKTKQEAPVQVLEEDDDFDLSGLQQKATQDDDPPADPIDEPPVKEEKKAADPIDDEPDDKPAEEKAGKEDEDDIFADEDPAEITKEEAVDFAELLSLAEIQGEGEIKDKKSFVDAVKKSINESKKQFDLSGYNEEAQKVIKHLNENKGDLATFFENPVISQMNRVLAMDPAERVREVRYAELMDIHKNDEEKAIEALEQEMDELSKGEIKTRAEDIAEKARQIRQGEINNLIGNKQEAIEKAKQQEKQRVEQERETLREYVNGQDDFFGLKLTKNAKATILKDIDNGKFDEIVQKTPQASKFFAYMVGKYSGKISERLTKGVKDAHRTGHNDMQDKMFNALHKTSATGAKSAGHSKASEQKRNFENLTADVFGEEG
jgi:hypothetical protein